MEALKKFEKELTKEFEESITKIYQRRKSMSTCPGCGAEMKHVPAGIARATGKPYEAFDACSAKCGWKPSKEKGVTKVVVESHLPSQVPQNTNDLRERSMVMSYAKDLVVQELASGIMVGEPSKEVVNVFRILWAEYKNPGQG
jgi:hypothetical protein